MDVNNTNKTTNINNTTNTKDTTESKIEKLLNRWLLGSDAPPKLADFPDSWHLLLEGLPIEKQAVTALGLLGHYQAMNEQPHAQTILPVLTSIPTIDAPLINSQLNSQHGVYYLASKLLENQDFAISTTNLLSQRGYALAPKDYFTYIAPQVSNNQDTIVVHDRVNYQPWQLFWETWKNRLTQTQYDDSLAIDEENWHDFMPAYRRQALSHLRKKDPTQARELIQSCFMQENAEERVKILKVLYINLSNDDVDFLKSLRNDRSQKVMTTANHLLTRTGFFSKTAHPKTASQATNTEEHEATQADLELLANGFTVTHDKKSCNIQAVVYRAHKKRHKRRDLLTKYGLMTLANVLNITLEQLLTGWQFAKHHEDDNQAFLQCASHLPDECMPYLIKSLQAYQLDNIHTIETIWRRFSQEQQQQLLTQFISKNNTELPFYQLLMLGTPLSSTESSTESSADLDLKALQKTQAWNNMFSKKQTYYIEENCLALGFLLPQGLAKVTLEHLQEKLKEEYSVNDPMFYSLRLNAGLAYNDEKK